MKVKIKRLWHGKASVRDYLVNEALLNHEELHISLIGTNQEMIIPYEDLIKKGTWNKEKFRSKHDFRTYSLVDYEFKPDERQTKLFV